MFKNQIIVNLVSSVTLYYTANIAGNLLITIKADSSQRTTIIYSLYNKDLIYAKCRRI